MRGNRSIPIVVRGILLLVAAIVYANVSLAADASRRTIDLKVGGSELMEMIHPVKRASVVEPQVADIVILSPKELYAFGKKPGYTSVILWEEGKGKTILDVTVSLDLTSLKEKIHQLFPNEKIEVHASETGIVLSGTVSGPEVMEQVLRLTRTYLPKLAEGGEIGTGTGKSSEGITNLLNIGGIQQVMLEVKIAEVNRTSEKDWQAALGIGKLGSDFAGVAGIQSVTDNLTDGVSIDDIINSVTLDGDLIQNPGSLLLNFAGNAANIFANIDNVTTALQLLEMEGMARTLAEPRLVTLSGQEASFLAGGEFPIPVPQEDREITIEYKEFGVALRFTPVVLSDGKISLRVAPSVSQIASASTIPAGIVGANFIVPNLSTRKLETSVQLFDGQTLALAGLLQDNLREEVNKIPGLGDIPILGPLFRSTSYQQEKTDLLIAVTPHLVKPVKEGEIRFPGENMQMPNAYEFYLEGRLEGRRSPDDESSVSKHVFSYNRTPLDKTGGLEGDFGHLPVNSDPLAKNNSSEKKADTESSFKSPDAP